MAGGTICVSRHFFVHLRYGEYENFKGTMNKFGKNREVDSNYLNIPIKYILNHNGSNEDGKNKYRYETYEEWKSGMESWLKDNPWFSDMNLSEETYENCKKAGCLKEILHKEAKDKTLCIVDFYGKKSALVAWRNNKTFKMGMTRLCEVVYKDSKAYIRYRGNLICISDESGWVF